MAIPSNSPWILRAINRAKDVKFIFSFTYDWFYFYLKSFANCSLLLIIYFKTISSILLLFSNFSPFVTESLKAKDWCTTALHYKFKEFF